MGQYRIRKAGPGETPGYYSKHQMGLKRFAEGGAQEDNSMDLSQMLPQISNTIASAIMQSEDPENTDIRPIMAQIAAKLRQSGVEPSAIESLVSAAGQQALQSVANMLEQQTSDDEETPEEQTTEVAEESTMTEDPIDYGYYDQSAATQGGEDDQVIDELLMRYGGTNGKRKFMRETMSHLNKAAEGMQQQSSNSASLRGTSDDIQGNELSSKHTFIPAVKQTAQYEVNKKFAEDQYNQMMNQQYKSGGENRRIRRANKALFGTPNALPGANVDYEFGPLGGLRHASVEFNPAMMQSMFGVQSVMPGMIAGQNGSYTPTYQIKGTRVKSSSETQAAQEAKAVNASTMGKVAKDTPNSEATSANRTIEQMRADALKYGHVEYNNGSGGWSAGTANSELNQGTNGNGRSGGNNAGGSNRPPVPNPVRTNPVVNPEPVVTPAPENKPGKPKVTNSKEVIIPGRTDYTYFKSSDGKWHYKHANGTHGYVTNKPVLDLLKQGKFKVPNKNTVRSSGPGMLTTKNISRGKYANESDEHFKKRQKVWRDSPWYERAFTENPEDEIKNYEEITGFHPENPLMPTGFARAPLGMFTLKPTNRLGPGQAPLGPGQPMIGPGQGMLNPGQGMLNPGQGMLNPGQRMLNPPGGYQYQLGFEEGGVISPELYKYVYGGDDFSQEDLDFTNSKDTSDAYFKDGGLYRFAGTDDSQVSQTNTTQSGTGLTKEDVQKMFDEYGKKMQTQQNQYGQQSYAPGSFGSAGYGQPMWGRPMYGQGYNGMMGQYGNMLRNPLRKDFKYLTPYGQGNNNIAINPMSVMAGSMANIQKSGMVPTKFSYGKERKEDGNWFERKLGFNKDRVWTIDYNKPNAGGVQKPNIGETKSAYLSRTTGNPGFAENNDTWDGQKWVKQSQDATGTTANAFAAGDPRGNYMKSQLTVPSQPVPTGFPANTTGPRNTEFAYGGYLDEYAIAGEINNQVNPMNNNIPTDMKIGEEIDELDNCSEEDKMDPSSPCYEKQTEQLKFKEETARTFDPGALKDLGLFAGRLGADTANQVQDYNNKFVPGMNKLIYDRGQGQQRINTGTYEENTGARNYTGFQGVVKKGGSTGLRENGEYQLTMDQIGEILKAGGKIEFLK